jgi:peptidyl-dipeptidase A
MSIRLLTAMTALMPALLAPSGSAWAQSPTAKDAEAFIAKVEADLVPLNEYAARVAWIGNNFITEDTMWLRTKVRAEMSQLQVDLAKQAASFDPVEVDPVIRRKLDILKRHLTMPAPRSRITAQQMAKLSVEIGSRYSTGKFTYRDQALTLDDISDLMKSSRDPAELKTLWEGWHAISRPMLNDYVFLVSLANQGASQLGYRDTGVLWRSWYDMPPDTFAAAVERLWSQLEPMYKNLQCYARRGSTSDTAAVRPRTGRIRADLLGNMWAQSWSNVTTCWRRPVTASATTSQGHGDQGYDVVKWSRPRRLLHLARLCAAPATFWTRRC